ncbi:MAG: alpha-E domain-containing protein [Caulobacteraceae bacterium]
MWERINDAWHELKRRDPKLMDQDAFMQFLEWVEDVALAFDGSARRTMLRNDAYWFLRLGAGIERADNTARILDVKYHLLLPEREQVGGGLDYFQWTTILREVSALTAYRWVYRDSVKPWLVADLLILNPQMPRSLASCYAVITHHLDLLAEAYGLRGQSQRLAHAVQSRLSPSSIDDIFQAGLHEFITCFLTDNGSVGAAVSEQYLI